MSKFKKLYESIINEDKLSANKIEKKFRDLDIKGAKEVMKLIDDVGSVRIVSENLEKINDLIDGYGIEAIRSEDANDSYYQDIIAEYVNMGDTYVSTILYDVEKEEFLLTSYGDWVEEQEKNGVIIK